MKQNIRDGFLKIKATIRGEETAYEYRQRALDYFNTTLKEIEEGVEGLKYIRPDQNYPISEYEKNVNQTIEKVKHLIQLIHQKLIK